MEDIKEFENFLNRMQGLLDEAKKQGHIIVRVEDLENAFPELKESEDERIKRELCKAIWTYIPNEEAHEYITWLEKQGEQKPQGKSALETVKEEKVDNANKVEPTDYSSIDTHFFKTTDKVEPKFGESKFSAWSEEDETMLDKVIRRLHKYTPGDEEYADIYYWLIALKDRQSHPKQEWSEKDNMMIEETLYFLREYQHSNRCKDENGMQNSVTCEEWLKSLKERYTWKSSKK